VTEQLRMIGRQIRRAEVIGRGARPRPNKCSQTRLTNTRAVSGLSFDASQLANSRRPLPVVVRGSRLKICGKPRGTALPGRSISPR